MLMDQDRAPASEFAAIPWFNQYNCHDYLFSNPPTEDIRQEINDFLTDGFVIVKNAASKERVQAAREAFYNFRRLNADLFARHENENKVVERIVNLHMHLPEIRDLFVSCDRALRIQDYLFGTETVLYTSLFFELGSQQPIHRDSPAFSTIPEYNYFGMWIPLDDVEADNGPLIAIRGGHLIREANRRAMAQKHFPDISAVPDSHLELWMDYQADVVRRADLYGMSVIELHVSAGDVIIWHPQLPHGGAKHLNMQKTRCTVVAHTTPIDTPVYHMTKFFNPDKEFSATPRWDYLPINNERRFANHGTIVDFNHKEAVQCSDLIR